MHQYRAFSLNIDSVIELPDTVAAHGELVADVTIDFSAEPGPVRPDDEPTLRLEVQSVAVFDIRGGHSISILPAPGASLELIRAYLMTSAFSGLLHQRELLVLHANAVEIGGGCVVIAGSSGFGKSTLAAGFLKRQRRILSDDLCAIRFEAGRPIALPSFPKIRLYSDSLAQINQSTAGLMRIDQRHDKFILPLRDQFCTAERRVLAVFVLDPGPVDDVSCEEIRGVSKFVALRENTFRRHYMTRIEQSAGFLARCQQLVASVPVLRLSRPTCRFDLDTLLDRVENEIGRGGDGIGSCVETIAKRVAISSVAARKAIASG